VERLGLTLTQAGWLGAMMVFSGSFLQPVYGYLSDRYGSRMFSALAPAVAGVFISAVCAAPSFPVALLLVFVGAAGVASFHPQASARATLGITARRARWMAVFISSGSLGLAFGPTAYSFFLERQGAPGAMWLALPGVMVTMLLVYALPEPAREVQNVTSRFDLEPLQSVWKPLTLHYLLVFLRSAVQITFGQFLPLYLHRERGYSLTEASLALSLYLASGALGGFLGGSLADRFGGSAVIRFSMIASVPFLALFFATSGWVSMACLALGGLTLLFTIPVNVLMAQELAPTQAGTVSALMMGFAWGFAGLVFIPLAGFISDRSSMGTALGALVLAPLAGFFLSLKLEPRRAGGI
jgi:FSR family fosmidomycin resistance protein-like MFS transporter